MLKPIQYFYCLLFAGVITACKNTDNVVNTPYVCPKLRFTTEQFTVVASTVLYGQATDYLGKNQNLLMDIDQPSADTLAHRPLIIYCHGGGFISGTRNNAWAVKFCQSFAKRGYVAASIDYRLGIGSGDDADVISAQVRAVQDAKAAVRYFKQTAIEQGNPYRIDTAQIYIAGESSGAVLALQMAYLRSNTDFADVGDPAILGALNGIEGSATLPYSSQIAGVISLSGGILDLNWLYNSTVPLIMVHSSNDAVMPYKTAIASPYTETKIYGSFSIDSASISLKLNSAFHTFSNAGTAPYISSTKYADSTIKYVSQELYGLIDCQRLGRR